MTPLPIEELAGTVDGVNDTFLTAADFSPGSVTVFLNGLVRQAGDADGWTESPPRTIILGEAPATGDTVHAHYLRVP